MRALAGDRNVMTPLALPERARILVVVLRRLGDVLLTTPLIRSLRRAWPDAALDVLVFSDTAAILEGNPDIDRVIALPQRSTFKDMSGLWRRYDLAITTQAGDRPTFLAFIAGRRRAGPYERRLIGRIKKQMLTRSLPAASGEHRVEEVLALARLLGIPPVAEVVCPGGMAGPPGLPPAYAVVHAAPMFRYKQWHDAGWRAVARFFMQQGLAVVATGGPAEHERCFLDALWRDMPQVIRLDGCLKWPELTGLLAGARCYVGPDTSVTHLAAAAGCPTVALFGPTDPRIWAPWPRGGLAQPWEASLPLQRRGNVWLVQNPLPCQPCQHEGCLRTIKSFSRCLDELAAGDVIAAAAQALSARFA